MVGHNKPTIKSLQPHQLTGIPTTVHVGATYPTPTTTGALWYNTGTGQLNLNPDGPANGWKQFATSRKSRAKSCYINSNTS